MLCSGLDSFCMLLLYSKPVNFPVNLYIQKLYYYLQDIEVVQLKTYPTENKPETEIESMFRAKQNIRLQIGRF